MYRLVLVRHGESEWNRENLFTGWYDCDLTERGEQEARAAGRLLVDAGVTPDVVHTSLQKRAIRTANLALDAADRAWIPVRRSWRLNERHYGDLTGRNKADTAARFGADQVQVWRRSYEVPPPPIANDNPHNPGNDARYADLAPDVVPAAECLADVVARLLPYWHDGLVPDLRAGHTVLVAAHGNSLRALVKHLDQIGDDEITGLNIPTGMPLLYQLGADLTPTERIPTAQRYLADPEKVAAAAAAVAAQASGA